MRTTSVDTTADPAEPTRPDLYGWDWSATTHSPRGTAHDATELAYDLLDALAPSTVLVGGGLQGWERSLIAYDAEGFKSGAVYFGGRDDVHVVSTSAAADAARPRVTRLHNARTSRVDTRVDVGPEGPSYEDLAGILEDAAMTYSSLITHYESKQDGVSRGRTVYLGAPSSAVRIRLYEKWLESPGQYPEGTNRVEVQLRPPSRSKGEVSGWEPARTFCASKVARDVAVALGDKAAPKGTLHVSRGVPDLERTITHMGHQYRRSIGEWLKVSDGDVGRVFDALGL